MKVLVVGFGSIAQKHLLNLQQCYPHAELAVWCRAGRPRPAWSLAGLFHSAQQALAWQPDYAIIASPASHHADHVAALAPLGIPLLVEKPLAMDLRQGERLLHVAPPHCWLGYQLRFSEGFGCVRQWLPTLGRLYFARLEVGQYLPQWRPNTPVAEMVSARAELGGGVLLELSHELDYLVALMGLPQCVYARRGAASHLGLAVEECVELTLGYEGGALVQVHMDMLQYKPCRRAKWVGEEGQLEWDLLTNSVSLYDQQGEICRHQQGAPAGVEMAQRQLRAFIEGTGEGTPAREGLAALRIIAAAQQAMANGREQPIDDQ